MSSRLVRTIVFCLFFGATAASGELRLYTVNANNLSPGDTTVTVNRVSDRANLAEIFLPTTMHAHSVVVHPNGLKAYVSGENFAVTVIDSLTNTVLGDIATPENLSAGMAFVPGRDEVLVCMRTGGVVRRIDTTTDSLVGPPIVTAPGPLAVVVTANGLKAYVLTATTVDVIDLTLPTPAVIASVTFGFSSVLQELAFSPDEALLYLTDAGADRLWVIRTSDDTDVTPAFFPTTWDFPRSLSVDGEFAYVGVRAGVDGNSVWVVRLSDGAVVEIVTDPDATFIGGIANPRKSVVSPDGSRLYVTAHGSTTVVEIDLETYCFEYINVGVTPVGLAIADVPAGDTTDADLDSAFSGDGKLVDDLGAGAGRANGVAAQCDGKIVVVGSSNGEIDFSVARYLGDGTLDPSFSDDGKDIRDVANGIDEAWDVAIQADGKIVVVGLATDTGEERFAVLRYLADGTLDPSFGSAGVVMVSFAGDAQARGVAIQADGKIVVVGRTDFGNAIAVARLTAGGVLDGSFSGDGKDTVDFGGDDQAWDVAIQPNGKIVVVGWARVVSIEEMVVLRYTTGGAMDTSFGAGGTGFARASFGGPSYGRGVVIQPDGKIVVVGSTDVESSMALARFDTDGTLDETFGCNGTRAQDFLWGLDEAWDVTLRPDGRILVAGASRFDQIQEFIVLRYLGDGTLDWSLGGTGYTSVNFGNDSYGQALAVRADGTIAVVGYRDFLGTPTPTLLRFKGWSDLLYADGFEFGDTCSWLSDSD